MVLCRIKGKLAGLLSAIGTMLLNIGELVIWLLILKVEK